MRPETLCVLAVLAWSGTDEPAEDFAEVALVDEAGAGAGFNDGHLRVEKKPLCLLYALAEHVLVRALAYALLERSSEMVEVCVGDFGQRGELELVVEIGVDIVEHLAET